MLIRYPGSKDSHLQFLTPYLQPLVKESRSVCEPFSGTASITFHMLQNGWVDRYWINDIDDSMRALWSTVAHNPQDLIGRVKEYKPKAEDFYAFKEDAGDTDEEKAFRKVVLHQISYSGLGGKAGSPIGGKEQKGAYLVDCRWSPDRLSNKIRRCSELLRRADEGVITSQDWKPVTEAAAASGHFVYLDPPYYNQGPVLYTNGTIDHDQLAATLETLETPWLVSYDHTPEVNSLYSWASVEELPVVSHLHHKTISDVMIRRLADAAVKPAASEEEDLFAELDVISA